MLARALLSFLGYNNSLLFGLSASGPPVHGDSTVVPPVKHHILFLGGFNLKYMHSGMNHLPR